MEVKGAFWEEDGLDGSLWTDGVLQYVRLQVEPDGSRVVVSAIASGDKASFLDSMPPAERGRYALEEIARIRPSTKGKLEVIGTHSWTDGPGASGCSFELPVGVIEAWLPAMAQPHGRVHFAGEHLRHFELGMEAAMESGERAARAIAARSVASR
jgi:monoamine oxidase